MTSIFAGAKAKRFNTTTTARFRREELPQLSEIIRLWKSREARARREGDKREADRCMLAAERWVEGLPEKWVALMRDAPARGAV